MISITTIRTIGKVAGLSLLHSTCSHSMRSRTKQCTTANFEDKTQPARPSGCSSFSVVVQKLRWSLFLPGSSCAVRKVPYKGLGGAEECGGLSGIRGAPALSAAMPLMLSLPLETVDVATLQPLSELRSSIPAGTLRAGPGRRSLWVDRLASSVPLTRCTIRCGEWVP